MRFLSIIFAGLSLVAAGSAVAQTSTLPQLPKIGIEGEDNRIRTDPKEWPWISIGRINREIGGHCTGTLIAPDLVLTAAHCLYNKDDGRWTIPMEVHFVAGYDRGSFSAHARGKAFYHDPDYNPKKATRVAEMARDWAIIELDQKLKLKPVPLSARTAQALFDRKPPIPVDALGYNGDWSEILMRHKSCDLEGELAERPLLLHRCDTTFGASGGPLLSWQGDMPEIVGVLSGVLTLKDQSELGAAVPAWVVRPRMMKLGLSR